jgi:hypothetical protein
MLDSQGDSRQFARRQENAEEDGMTISKDGKAAVKKNPAARGKTARSKTTAAKPADAPPARSSKPVQPANPPTAKSKDAKPKATRKTPEPARRVSGKARVERQLPRAVAARRVPGSLPQPSWGHLVDSLNARVAARSVSIWDTLAHNMATTRELPPPLPRTANIEANAPDGVRAHQFLSMARGCIADLHRDRPLSARENMARFLLHVAWHGSQLHFRRLGSKALDDGEGAARGLIPFEAHRAKDTLMRLVRAQADRVAYRLGNLSGLGWPGLVRAAHSLPDWGTGGRGARFPEGHLIESLLERNDQFNVYLARAAFLLIPLSVPVGNTNHAEYWYAYWCISGPDPERLQLTFRTDADEVDALIDG